MKFTSCICENRFKVLIKWVKPPSSSSLFFFPEYIYCQPLIAFANCWVFTWYSLTVSVWNIRNLFHTTRISRLMSHFHIFISLCYLHSNILCESSFWRLTFFSFCFYENKVFDLIHVMHQTSRVWINLILLFSWSTLLTRTTRIHLNS